MKKYKKENGFVLFIVIIMIVLLSGMVVSVTMLSSATSRNIASDMQKNKSYYLANAGLEIVYGALTHNNYGAFTSILQRTGQTGDFEHEIKRGSSYENILKDSYGNDIDDFAIMSGSNVLGHVKLRLYLQKDSKDRLYYRIVSTSSINNSSLPSDSYTLTMFVYNNDWRDTKIYNGDKLEM